MERLTQAIILAIMAVFIAYLMTPEPSIPPDSLAEEYDYIVVGAGSAGSILAYRLSESKEDTVLLAEAGDHFDGLSMFTIPFAAFTAQGSDYDWAYYTTPQQFSHLSTNDRRGYWPRGRVLGGTSMINFLQYTRGSKYDFDEWESNGCEGWGYKDVLPYFLKTEDIQIEELKSSAYHSTGGPMAVTGGRVTPLADLYIKAGQELGYNQTDYNGETQHGFSKVQLNIRNGIRSSPAIELLSNRREILHIATRALVTKVEIENQKAVGIFIIKGNRKYFIKVRKEIILSAGAVNTPQLLMLSGIGPKHHLKSLGIDLVKDLPVGQNLQDHLVLLMFSNINSSVSVTADVAGNIWTNLKYFLYGKGPLAFVGTDGNAFLHTDKSKVNTNGADIQMAFFSGLIAHNSFNYKDDVAKEYMTQDLNAHGFTTAVFNTHPRSKGELKLKSIDPFEYPDIDPNYLSDPEDVRQLVSGLKLWEALIETPTMKSLDVRPDQMRMSFCSEHVFRSVEYWECFIRHLAVTAFHPCCTAKMGGKSDTHAVVDTNLRVKGIQGLRVADASVFPNITSGNIQTPTIMIAERAADFIHGIYSVGTRV